MRTDIRCVQDQNIAVVIVFLYELDAQILYFNAFITFLYMFRALLCSSSRGLIVLVQHLVSSVSLGDWSVQNSHLKRVTIPDAVLIQLDILKMSTIVLETCTGILTFCWPCISVINQPDAQNLYFTISLFHASPCFEYMCSKHVEAWNKLIVKQQFCASSWLITEINVQECNKRIKIKNLCIRLLKKDYHYIRMHGQQNI